MLLKYSRGFHEPILPSCKQKRCVAHRPRLLLVFDYFCFYCVAVINLRFTLRDFAVNVLRVCLSSVDSFPSPPLPFLYYIFSESCYLITDNYETDDVANFFLISGVGLWVLQPLLAYCTSPG
jgi:hypothetical protein